MRTSCSHCGAQFEVPDKALGKQAQCKTCGKLFVLMPVSGGDDVPMQEITPPRSGGSTARLNPVRRDEVAIDSSLDALADAAIESGSHLRPVGGVSSSTRRRDFAQDVGRRRMARGATLSMSLGITGMVLSVLGGGSMVAGMVVSKNQDALVILGLITVALLLFAGGLGMIAVVNATSASRRIRQARHPIGGRSQASTGVITGWITLGIVFIATIAGGVWLARRGGINFEKEVTAEGDPAPLAPQQGAGPTGSP